MSPKIKLTKVGVRGNGETYAEAEVTLVLRENERLIKDFVSYCENELNLVVTFVGEGLSYGQACVQAMKLAGI